MPKYHFGPFCDNRCKSNCFLNLYPITVVVKKAAYNSASPRLRIKKKVDEDFNLGHTRPSSEAYADIVPNDS